MLPLLPLLLLLLLQQQAQAAAATAAANCSDWLVRPCGTPSTLLFNASTGTYLLSNGIVSRTLQLNASTQQLSTVSLRSLASGEEKLRAAVAEAALEVNGARAYIGGVGSGGLRFAFAAARQGLPRAGDFPFTPGARGSRAGKPWPPLGVRAEFDHALPCAALGLGGGGALTATVVYELYDGTSAFGKRILLRHTCAAPLFVFNMSVSLLALARDLAVETFTDASISEVAVDGTDAPPGVGVWNTKFLPIAASHAYDHALPAYGPGLSFFTSADAFTSFLCVEVVHDADRAGGAAHGMSAFGLESARMWRTLAPQTEQFPVVANAMCAGGSDLPAGDPRTGSWCYDAEGTAQLSALIAQAAALGFEGVDVSLNMNSTWRSQVGVEFQSAQNISWFAALVGQARALGMEMGAYDLLRNARSATAPNQCAPDNAASLPLRWHDDMDLPPPLGTGLPCHNGGSASCRGGPGCCSLCSATDFYDGMEASIFDFWDRTGMTLTEQDGAESNSPCANASHLHHHGLNDSVWVKWQRVHDTFKGYLKRGGFIQGMPGHWLEGGQAKVPGGYDEMTWSLPRWTWIHRQRERMIADPQQRDRTEPNALRYFCAPFTPYHPLQVLPGGSAWSPVVGLESTATLEPLEEHALELEWALSQSFGTGIFVNFRGTRMAGGPRSAAVVAKWVAWFKRYRQVLGADFVTLQAGTVCWGAGPTQPTSACTVSTWDGVLHRAPAGFYPDIAERGLAVLWNPLNASLQASVTLPLEYAGLARPQRVRVRQEEGAPTEYALDANNSVSLAVQLQPLGITYLVVEAA
jgi:hypothetical protein